MNETFEIWNCVQDTVRNGWWKQHGTKWLNYLSTIPSGIAHPNHLWYIPISPIYMLLTSYLQWTQTEITLALGLPMCIDQIKIVWDYLVFTKTRIQAARIGFQLLKPQPWYSLVFLKKQSVKMTPMLPLVWIMVLLHFGVGPILYVILNWAWWNLRNPEQCCLLSKVNTLNGHWQASGHLSPLRASS